MEELVALVPPLHQDLILEHETRLFQSSATISEWRGLLPGDASSNCHHGSSEGSNQLRILQKDAENVHLCKQNDSNSSLANAEERNSGTRTDQKDHTSSLVNRFSAMHSENCKLAKYGQFATRRSNHFHSTRLKQKTQVLWTLYSLLQHSISLSFASGASIKWRVRTNFATTLVLFLFLLSSLIYPVASENGIGIQSHQKSHSSSPFNSWTIADVDSDIPQVSEHSKSEPFKFPDFVIAVNRLFQYQIPHAAFSDMELVQHYQVCGCVYAIVSAVVAVVVVAVVVVVVLLLLCCCCCVVVVLLLLLLLLLKVYFLSMLALL